MENRINLLQEQIFRLLAGKERPQERDPLFEILTALMPKTKIDIQFKKELEQDIASELGLPTERQERKELERARSAFERTPRVAGATIPFTTDETITTPTIPEFAPPISRREEGLKSLNKFLGIPKEIDISKLNLDQISKLVSARGKSIEKVPTALKPITITENELKFSTGFKKGDIVPFHILQASMREFARRQRVTREGFTERIFAELSSRRLGGNPGDVEPKLAGFSDEELEKKAFSLSFIEQIFGEVIREQGQKQSPREEIPRGKKVIRQTAIEELQKVGAPTTEANIEAAIKQLQEGR